MTRKLRKGMKLLTAFILTLCLAQVLHAQNSTVSGRVTSKKDGAAMPGVNVLVKGTANGTTTDADGKYTLVVNSSDATLSFSFIGFATIEIPVGGQTLVDAALEEDVAQLGEVVVTAFGISKENKSLGYATSTVTAKDLTQTASPNFASALYGKAPGVRIATTPGGATSAVNITVRGVNSITGKNQPLIVLNGIPIRDGEVNNGNYWDDQRIRGNGLLDINPDDIENISILKGASAAALYGSDAVNGVVLITTKSGKGTKGFKIDVSSSYTMDKIAYLPRYQNERGQGFTKTFADVGQADDMFMYRDLDGDGVTETRSVRGTSLNFGPKFDGKPTMAWDGVVRPYEAQKDNYGKLFQTAVNQINSVAVSYGGDNSNIRLSFTRQDNQGLSLGAKNEKNIANLNASFNLGKNDKIDVMVNYINQYTKNRPYSVDRMINNFTGMMGRFDNGDWYLDRYKTSRGYRYVTGTNQSLTPNENINGAYGFRDDIMDYVWRVKENRSEERSDRVIANITNTWTIIPSLKLRTRFGADVTMMRTEDKNTSERPLTFGYSGYFGMANYTDNLFYTDAMLTYTKKVNEDIELGIMGGYTATKDVSTNTVAETNGGLSTENMFDLAASVNKANINLDRSYRNYLVKDAFIATINGNYKNFLFVEATGRRDRTSTMSPSNNAFFYPSVNSSFVISDAFSLPQKISFARFRASWGIVGNYPSIYGANIAYSQNTLGSQGGGSVLYTTIPSAFGNDHIKPEQKQEFEFGLETKYLGGRLGLDVTYYNGQIVDQILPLSMPASAGATSVLTNIGTLRNQGLEIALSGTPIKTPRLTWDVTLNFARNSNVVEKLATGSNELLHADYDGNAAQLKSVVGQPMGDIYVHPIITDTNGKAVIDQYGLYQVDPNKMVNAGNTMPKAIGGLLNTLTYKNFRLFAVIDYRYGGYVMPTGLFWMISRGLTEESLQGMDAAHGGISWYQDGTGKRVRTTASVGPNGEKVYDDGIILDGVKADGSPNDNIATNTEYYSTTYNWGGPQYSPNTRYDLYVQENSYVKMRELSLSYRLPVSIASKIKAKNIEVSVFGRNLFFIYRTIKDIDPEQTTAGSRWFQNVNNLGTNPSSRSYGISLKLSF